MLLTLAATSQHLGVYVAVLAIGFVIGAFGQMTRSRTLLVTGLIVIAGVSLYFLIQGENAANCHGACL